MTPYFGTISLAFVGPPTIKVQLLPYNRVRLMQVPIVQVSNFAFLSINVDVMTHLIMHASPPFLTIGGTRKAHPHQILTTASLMSLPHVSPHYPGELLCTSQH